MKTVKFYTLGCKVNQYDTQSIREDFLSSGFKEIKGHSKADIYVINTCSVTHRADSDSFSLIHRVNKENPGARLIVTGCLAELDESKIRQHAVDTVSIVKNKDKNRILDFLGLHCKEGGRKQYISDFSGHTRAFLKIQDGCNNFCSYCKVPLVRGLSVSRAPEEAIKEARSLVGRGFKEIVLCGICLGSFGCDLRPKSSLVRIINDLEKIESLLRIRLSSIEANDISDELIKRIAGSKKLCRHLHIPMQSGDNRVLKAMKRSYTRNDYLKLVKKIYKAIPGVAITTDVLVGFPGESEKNFMNTVKLIKEICPLKVHIFPFSPRENTPAFNLKGKIGPEIVKNRAARLREVAIDCSEAFKKQFLNSTLLVLVEGRNKNNPSFYDGYTDNYIKVLFKSRLNLKNQMINLKLRKLKEDLVLGLKI